MSKEGLSPYPRETDRAPYETTRPDSSNATGASFQMESSRNASDSLSDHSSDCDDYPSSNNQSSSIPTCVVAPTSTDPDDYIPSRKQREFIPEAKKDDHYWEKRRKNNDAARRSREKRRYHDVALENRIVDLTRDNCGLRNELYAIKKRFGVPLNEKFVGDDDPSVVMPPKRIHSDNSNSPLESGSQLGGLSPPHTRPPGFMQMGLGPGNHSAVSIPPPLLHMPGGMPMVNFGVNGPVPLYVTVPTSESLQTSVPPPLSSAYRDKDDEDHPPPAHSQRIKREIDHEAMYGSDRPLYYPGGGATDRQGSPVSLVSTSMYSSAAAYSRNFATAARSSAPMKHNISADYSDDNSAQEEPLSLTVNKNYGGAAAGISGNESSNSNSNSTSSSETVLSQSPPTTALPHKLRHKSPSDYGSFAQLPGYANHPLINGLAQLSEIALAQSGPLPLLKSSSTGRKSGHKHSARSHIDPKYAERRRRNNEAARKCRENRKSLTSIREAKSDYLCGENGKLRDELDDLQSEMSKLKEMLERKRRKESQAHDNNPGGYSSQ